MSEPRPQQQETKGTLTIDPTAALYWLEDQRAEISKRSYNVLAEKIVKALATRQQIVVPR